MTDTMISDWLWQAAPGLFFGGVFCLLVSGVWWASRKIRKKTAPYPYCFRLITTVGIGALATFVVALVILVLVSLFQDHHPMVLR